MEQKYPKNSCAKTILSCDRSQYGEVGYWQRAKMKFHIFFCSACKNYSKKNSNLSKALKKSRISSLKPNEISELKQRLGASPNE